MKNQPYIGIVGGVGPYAGMDLCRKVFDNTIARSDQEHISVALLSDSCSIEDRTRYLLGQSNDNPAFAMTRVIQQLESLGARVVGIPCNTAHSPRIFDVIVEELRRTKSAVKLLHMIDEVAKFTVSSFPLIENVGVLSTTGTYKTRVYADVLARNGLKFVDHDEGLQEKVHQAIYDREYGIKAQSNPVTKQAKIQLEEAIQELRKRGAEAVIMGCTELPLAITEATIDDIIIIEPTEILARALIRETCPQKLKPANGSFITRKMYL